MLYNINFSSALRNPRSSVGRTWFGGPGNADGRGLRPRRKRPAPRQKPPPYRSNKHYTSLALSTFVCALLSISPLHIRAHHDRRISLASIPTMCSPSYLCLLFIFFFIHFIIIENNDVTHNRNQSTVLCRIHVYINVYAYIVHV